MGTSGIKPITVVLSAGQVRQTAVLLAVSMFLPFVFHLLPSYDDTAWGPRLLPIFYAPLIAVFLYKPHVSLILAVVPPWLNHFITGAPPVPLAVLLSCELILFSAWARLFKATPCPAWLVGPAAYLAGKPILVGLLFLIPNLPGHQDPIGWALRTGLLAVPGLFILAAIGFFVAKGPHRPAAA